MPYNWESALKGKKAWLGLY